MTDWYRRTDWNDEAATDFEARLARARPRSRAQYLSLQGYALLRSHPDHAERLLERAVSSGEASELPRACCYLALSRVAQGRIDEAIEAYDMAIEAERRAPAFRSTAGVDRAFLVAMFDRRDRFRQSLDQLAMSVDDDWSLASVEAQAAEAIIRDSTGDSERARGCAREALSQMMEAPADRQWAGISFEDLRARLEAIAR